MYRIIFKHIPKEGEEKKFIEQWKKGSKIVQGQPGASGTKLFRSPENPKILYAMAEWESKQYRDKAIEILKNLKDAELILHGHEKFVESHIVVAEGELIEKVDPIN